MSLDAEGLRSIDHVLSTTRAVRRRLDFERPVGRDVLLECIDVAQQAPTGSNSQSWKFLVVTDPARRRALAEIYRDAAEGYFDQPSARALRSDQDLKNWQSAKYLADNLERVPVLIIPCVRGRLIPGDSERTATVYGSIVPAAWSLMLALRARGLGTVWTTLHLRRERAAAELLGIPDGMMQAAMIPVAYFTGTDFAPARRPPAEDIVQWNGWSSDT